MEGAFGHYRIRVSAAVLGREQKMLVVQHLHGGETFWTFPGGYPNLGESLAEAVVREFREETGYGIALGGVLAVGELRVSRWETPRIEIVFAGDVRHVGRVAPRAQDHALVAEWRTLEELRDAFRPRSVLRAAIYGRSGLYLGNIADAEDAVLPDPAPDDGHV